MPGDEIFYLSVSELAKRIESKKLSPVTLTQAYLDRSQKLGPRFNAYARLTPEIALEQAKAAEKEIQRGHYRGPLHGIPYAAKDLLAVDGLPLRLRLLAGRNQKSLGYHLLDLRLVFRFGCRRGRGTGCFCDRHGNMGFHNLSFGLLRSERSAADLRPRQPLRR